MTWKKGMPAGNRRGRGGHKSHTAGGSASRQNITMNNDQATGGGESLKQRERERAHACTLKVGCHVTTLCATAGINLALALAESSVHHTKLTLFLLMQLSLAHALACNLAIPLRLCYLQMHPPSMSPTHPPSTLTHRPRRSAQSHHPSCWRCQASTTRHRCGTPGSRVHGLKFKRVSYIRRKT